MRNSQKPVTRMFEFVAKIGLICLVFSVASVFVCMAVSMVRDGRDEDLREQNSRLLKEWEQQGIEIRQWRNLADDFLRLQTNGDCNAVPRLTKEILRMFK